MSGFYKRAVVWLGLNEEYPEDGRASAPSEHSVSEASIGDGEIGTESDVDGAAQRPSPAPRPRQARATPPDGDVASQDPLAVNASRDSAEGSVRVVPLDEPSGIETTPTGGSEKADMSSSTDPTSTGTVRAVPMPATVTPEVIVPQSFNDAQVVGDHFRDGTPTIVNMKTAERDLARRLIDFSSGLCYGLDGQMEKIDRDVYLLTPNGVEVAEAERSIY